MTVRWECFLLARNGNEFAHAHSSKGIIILKKALELANISPYGIEGEENRIVVTRNKEIFWREEDNGN